MQERNAGVDHIRIMLTALVVFHHVAITYGGSGGWYWREEADGSNLGLVAFNAINQSFFMGFFFLLAGYFSAKSLGVKEHGVFLKDRFQRLGWPMLAFFLILSPLTGALANMNNLSELWPLMLYQWRNVELGVGPLWFCEALLIFSALLVLSRKLNLIANLTISSFPHFGILALIAIALGLTSFMVRLAVPVGTEVLWLQLAYFPCYVFLYFAGVVAWNNRLLENVTARLAFTWILISLVFIGTIPLALSGVLGEGAFQGGMNINALFYALWDPLVGFGIIIFMLWLFIGKLSTPTTVTDFMARRAYSVFILHPPVVVSFSRIMEEVAIAPIAKFFIVGTASFIVCLLIASVLLSIRLLQRIL